MTIENSLSPYQWLEIACFAVGYLCIIFEHSIKVNKATSALIMAVVLWVLKFFDNTPDANNMMHLNHQLASVSQIILFLLGALTIVEQIHIHGGLSIVRKLLIRSTKFKTIFVVSAMTFLMSSILDNLTTTIVMVMMIRKSVEDRQLRLTLGGLVVIAANAGGAWTPIGDVTTTMLWIGGQLTSHYIITSLFIPSVACVTVSSFLMARAIPSRIVQTSEEDQIEPKALLVLIMGTLSLVMVPIFKAVTGLPPFMGMLFAMSIMWLVTDYIHKDYSDRDHLKIMNVFPRVDMSSILFFLGILLAVASLEEAGILHVWAQHLENALPTKEVVAIAIGLISAVVDNVPLVAGCMGMYNLIQYPTDSSFWSLIAYCAGTGGSILLIGSAAGVAFLGLEKVDFFWYLKRVTPAAFVGYIAGVAIWFLQSYIFACV